MTTQPAPAVGPGSAAAPASAGPGGHHDWHSREYVGEWIRDYEGRLESRRPQFDLLAALIPYAPDAPIRILDLGGGWGPVTRHVLERFPAASAVLLDYSEVMLEEASRRLAHLAGRVRLVQGDLSAPGAVARAAGEGEAARTACRTACRSTPSSRRCASTTCAPPSASPPCSVRSAPRSLPAAASWTSTSWAARPCSSAPGTASRSSACAPSARPRPVCCPPGRRSRRSCWPRASAAPDAHLGPRRRAAADGAALTRTLADHLLWLREAGFDAVDCFWRQERHAIVGGFVAPTA